MKNILGTFIIAYLAFMTGGYCVKDEPNGSVIGRGNANDLQKL